METSIGRDILTLLGISLLVQAAWSVLELNMTGQVVVSDVDTIVAVVLNLSLFANLKYREEIKALKDRRSKDK